jgi:hypothetical protein
VGSEGQATGSRRNRSEEGLSEYWRKSGKKREEIREVMREAKWGRDMERDGFGFEEKRKLYLEKGIRKGVEREKREKKG